MTSIHIHTEKTITHLHIDQIRQVTQSHTVGAVVTSSDASDLGPSSHNSPAPAAGVHIPSIPHKSSRRNLRSTKRDFSVSSPEESGGGLIRPMPTSHSISSHFNTHSSHRVTHSSSSTTGNTAFARYKGDSPIRKGIRSPRKISHSVTSALTSSEYHTNNVPDCANLGGPPKTSRSRTKNVFAKFADVLTEHFTAKGFRKSDKSAEPMGITIKSSEKIKAQVDHSQTLIGLSLNPLPLPLQHITNTRSTCLVGDDGIDTEKPMKLIGRVKAGSSTVRKRLTIVDEVDFQHRQTIEDPFSESSSGQHTTEFEARLRLRQGIRRGPTPTDPFQAEHILESSVDAILATPPVGCSTPRRRPLSLSRCETPTQRSREPEHVANMISFSPGISSAGPERRRKISALQEGPHKENKPVTGYRHRGFSDRANSRPGNSTSSDSTKLSAYPPGSTIRHVPRSMGRLTETSALPEAVAERAKALSLGRKKHPSPSKGQLELFGKYMEKNLALGVFKDADELGMSFNSPRPGARILSSRDTNRLMRNTAVSDLDLRKDYRVHGNHTNLPKSRSRIPQPMRQLSRSRTDIAFARDFIPANKGDSTMGDELQWDASAYKIGPRCSHCGSTNQIG